MKIRQIAGFALMSDGMRQDIEDVQFSDLALAQRYLERRFPHHIVHPRGERIDITNRDGSFVLFSFRRF